MYPGQSYIEMIFSLMSYFYILQFSLVNKDTFSGYNYNIEYTTHILKLHHITMHYNALC